MRWCWDIRDHGVGIFTSTKSNFSQPIYFLKFIFYTIKLAFQSKWTVTMISEVPSISQRCPKKPKLIFLAKNQSHQFYSTIFNGFQYSHISKNYLVAGKNLRPLFCSRICCEWVCGRRERGGLKPTEAQKYRKQFHSKTSPDSSKKHFYLSLCNMEKLCS